MLATARKEQKLELATVAESTGMSRGVLTALESDDWEYLDAPVYVRGYLRKYAHLLGLDEETILAAYALSAAPHDPAIHAHVTAGLGGQHEVRWLIPVTGLVVLIALILVGLWGWKHLRTKASQAPATAVSAMMTSSQGQPAGTGTSVTALATSGKSNSVASSGGIHLRLRLLKPSWIEVYGPGHKRLYYNLAAAGTPLHFDVAKGPLSVFLGNASGVELELNGKAFEIPKADIRGNTARFEVHLKKAPKAGTMP
jgi:cytoskeleton protein RodZ